MAFAGGAPARRRPGETPARRIGWAKVSWVVISNQYISRQWSGARVPGTEFRVLSFGFRWEGWEGWEGWEEWEEALQFNSSSTQTCSKSATAQVGAYSWSWPSW